MSTPRRRLLTVVPSAPADVAPAVRIDGGADPDEVAAVLAALAVLAAARPAPPGRGTGTTGWHLPGFVAPGAWTSARRSAGPPQGR